MEIRIPRDKFAVNYDIFDSVITGSQGYPQCWSADGTELRLQY